MRLIAPFALSVIFSLSNCQITKPNSDSTPPIVRWIVKNTDTGVTTNIVGSGFIEAKQGESFSITEMVEDPEGVQYIELYGNFSVSCIKGDIVSGSGPTIEAGESQTLSPNADGKVLNSIFLLRDTTPLKNEFKCQDGYNFNGASYTLTGTGRNYFNGETKAALTFKISTLN